MASSIPSQNRTVDPFASYDSNTVNKLTNMVTYDEEGLATINALRVTDAMDATSVSVLVSTGFTYKDEVLIQITSQETVDFNTADDYYDWDSPGLGFNENGYYYIVMNYVYVKSRPAPQASYQIVKPSQRGAYSIGGSWVFLAAVLISGVGGSGAQIDSILDYDPENPDNKREYVKTYVGSETTLPTHDETRDRSRFAYEAATDTFWFGYTNRWSKVGAGVELDIDTTGLNVGELCYTDSAGAAAPAIATDANTGAEMVIAAIGLEVDRSGRVLLSGFAEQVPIETGIIINVGDLLYLSNTEAGKATNLKTTPARQVVGRALSGGNSSIPVDIIFFPRDVLSIALMGTIEPGDWAGPDGDGLYFEEIDISALDVDSTHPTVLVNIWDDANDKKLSPADSQIIANGTALRIYSTVNTLTWNYIISTGGGSIGTTGGGGGTTDHSLLFNLDFGSSGHTGFAPSPHGNAHHSSTFIELTDVTFAALNGNGDVGTGAAQVAQGNHTHAGLIDVPSGEIILFENDVQVTGYSLLATVDDQLVYISSGGAGGTKPLSTWSQPNHGHPSNPHTLITSEIPIHDHSYTKYNDTGGYVADTGSGWGTLTTVSTGTAGGGGSHTHGTSQGNATSSGWRPLGRNFTRQQRN